MSPSDTTVSDESIIDEAAQIDTLPMNQGDVPDLGSSSLDQELSSIFETKMAPIAEPLKVQPAPSTQLPSAFPDADSTTTLDVPFTENSSSSESVNNDIATSALDEALPHEATPNQELSQEEKPVKPMDFQEARRLQQEKALRESTSEVIEDVDPLKMLRKGAVAAVGGTMVGLGLVMIPLPTPFGAVVASSGMAVLGTEFESAKELNQKIIKTTTSHLESARDKVIQSIESMEDDRTKAEEGTNKAESELGSDDESSQSDTARDDGESNGSHNTEKEVQQRTLYMNPLERKRQEEAARIHQQNANKVSYYDAMKRRAGAYLNKNLVPMLRRTQITATDSSSKTEAGLVPDLEGSVDSLGAGTDVSVAMTVATKDDGSAVIVDFENATVPVQDMTEVKNAAEKSEDVTVVIPELSKTGLALSSV